MNNENKNIFDDELDVKKSYNYGIITGFLIATAVFLVVAMIYYHKLSKYTMIKNNGKVVSVDDEDKLMNKIDLVASYLNKYYMEDVDEEDMVEGIFYGMAASVGDVYTTYYDEEAFKKLQDSTAGEYCGIGVEIKMDTETSEIMVSNVFSKSPAKEAGIEVGDVIFAIDGTEVKGMTTTELVNMVAGKADTPVKVEVKRDGEKLSFEMKRRKIEKDLVLYEMKDNNVGYIKILEFDDVVPGQVKEGINSLLDQGMEKIIIDLRDNPGGNLDDVKEIASFFLPKDQLFIYSQTKDGTKTKYYTEDKLILEDMPMCVLVNESSASASEAFSGAMQCYDRGVVVGTTTFGKGIMQTIFQLGDGTGIKITIGKYYLPDGSNIHKTGITPDYEVEESQDENIDAVLDKAMELLTE